MWSDPGLIEYLDLITAGHTVTFWADIFDSTILAAPTRFVQVVSGSVTADYESDVRYTATLTLNQDIDQDISTIDSQYTNLHRPDDLLNIYTTRIALFAGVVGVPGNPGIDFRIPIGMYRAESATWGSDKLYELELSGFESYVVDYVYEHPISLAERYPNMPIVDIIKKIIAECVENPTFDTSSLPAFTGTYTDIYQRYKDNDIREGSRWETVKFLAQLIDCDVYAGPTGAFHITERPSRKSRYRQFPAVWTALMGEINAYPKHVPSDQRWSNTITQTSMSVSRDSVFNSVVVYNQSNSESTPSTSSAEGTPSVPVYPYGVAMDVDPDSPINWFGPFGKKPYRVESNCKDASDCMWKAYYLLNDVRGNNRVTTFTSVPNHALEPGDLIYVEERLGTVVKHQIKTISFDLSFSGGMSITTAAKSELKLLTWEEITDSRTELKSTDSNEYKYTEAEKNAMAPRTGDFIWDPQHREWRRIRALTDLIPKA
jgi:hypothetical protein